MESAIQQIIINLCMWNLQNLMAWKRHFHLVLRWYAADDISVGIQALGWQRVSAAEYTGAKVHSKLKRELGSLD